MKRLLKGIAVILITFMTMGCDDNMKKDEDQTKDNVMMANIAGTWKGQIETPGQPLEIILNFSEGEERNGTISIPIQNVENIPLSDIVLKSNKVSFMMPLPGQSINFEGTLESNELRGIFTQNGQSFPFVVEKGATNNQAESGQENEDFLSIQTNSGVLYGSILVPKKEDKSPVALIIPGSGPTDRNGNALGLPGKNNSLQLLAEGLADNGIASLRYDKRGAGKNIEATIAEEDMRFDQFVTDAKQWITKLKQDDRFTDVIVIGHSQGSLVGMMAAENSDVSAFISLAGAGRSIDQVLIEQIKTLPDNLYEESQAILEQLKQGGIVNNVSNELLSIFRPSVQPFLISWMQYNPTDEIKQLGIPSLIVNGKNDLQVPVDDAKRLAEAKPDATTLLIDKMNHVLKEAPTDREGNMAAYSDPSLSLAEGFLEGIIEFLGEHDIVVK
ncbi:alpha/beta hydrolase [Lentibacillus sp. Marseille-P4043]|uniref:alpha/beta hydrolase n=1 Tax=Lentibacillus sp. Marseille-P4043 TaxID=2040293 RepID=UPI000D0B1623|nr:alpha/beta fold hydrolase [Lentibacillus sp. Marseille-P4043]